MLSALQLRTDCSPADLRRLSKKTKDNNQSRRLLSLAAVLDRMNRMDAAHIGGMDRQTLRNWVHRVYDQGPYRFCDVQAGGLEPRLSEEKLAELAAIVEARADRPKEGAAIASPWVNTEAMQTHVDEIACNVASGAHAVLIMDRAAWHTTSKLHMPTNITPILLPSWVPELYPVENVWQYTGQLALESCPRKL